MAAKKPKKVTKPKKAEKQVPFNEMFPSALKIRSVQDFLRKRSK